MSMTMDGPEALDETLDLLATPGAVQEIRQAEGEIARGEGLGVEELRRMVAARVEDETGC